MRRLIFGVRPLSWVLTILNLFFIFKEFSSKPFERVTQCNQRRGTQNFSQQLKDNSNW
jgi:hypothetical protein